MSMPADKLGEDELKRWRSLFDVVDVNGDGKICEAEVVKVMQNMGYPIPETEAQELISRCNPDAAGDVTFEAFCGALIKIGVKFRVSTFLCGLFREMDANHDGQVTVDEVNNLVARAGAQDRISPAVVAAFIKQADTSGDGQVSVEEFLAYIKDKLKV